MKLGARAEYALKTLIELGARSPGAVVSVPEIAQKQGIAAPFLEQILLMLKSGKLVESRRGVRGGYVLRPAAARASVGAVLRLVGDQLGEAHSDERGSGGRRATDVVIDEMMTELGAEVTRRFEEITVGELCARAVEKTAGAVSDYVI